MYTTYCYFCTTARQQPTMSGETLCRKKLGCPWCIPILVAVTFRTEHLTHTLYYGPLITLITYGNNFPKQ